MTSDNIETILESDALETDKHFVSRQQMMALKDELLQQGLKFEVFENPGEAYLELNFPTYQVSMFNSQIVVSVPYWDSNVHDGIHAEIKSIANTLLDNGFTGYDPQTEEFIVSKYAFQQRFTESKTVVDKTLNPQADVKPNYAYVGLGIAVIVIGIIIWKLLR